MEVLVALLIWSVLAAGLLGGLLGAQRLIGRIAREAAASSRLLQLDRLVRREVGSIRAPFWVREPEVRGGPQRLEIPYRGGDPSDRLVLESRDGWLRVGGIALGPFEEVQLGLERGEDGRARGVRVEVGLAPGARALVYARFASQGF